MPKDSDDLPIFHSLDSITNNIQDFNKKIQNYVSLGDQTDQLEYINSLNRRKSYKDKENEESREYNKGHSHVNIRKKHNNHYHYKYDDNDDHYMDDYNFDNNVVDIVGNNELCDPEPYIKSKEHKHFRKCSKGLECQKYDMRGTEIPENNINIRSKATIHSITDTKEVIIHICRVSNSNKMEHYLKQSKVDMHSHDHDDKNHISKIDTHSHDHENYISKIDKHSHDHDDKNHISKIDTHSHNDNNTSKTPKYVKGENKMCFNSATYLSQTCSKGLKCSLKNGSIRNRNKYCLRAFNYSVCKQADKIFYCNIGYECKQEHEKNNDDRISPNNIIDILKQLENNNHKSNKWICQKVNDNHDNHNDNHHNNPNNYVRAGEICLKDYELAKLEKKCEIGYKCRPDLYKGRYARFGSWKCISKKIDD